MKYLEFTFTTTPQSEIAEDVLSDLLANIGFDSFVRPDALEWEKCEGSENPENPNFQVKDGEDLFKAYIQADLFDADALDSVVRDFPLHEVQITYAMTEAEDKDWNEEWEKNYFQPLIIGNRCVVAGTFHKDVPVAEYHITIDPHMSFGTGHHATTAQMLERILDDDMSGKEVLDMGCGTSILAILARMRGAAHCVAIDNDEWCVKNSLENISLNQIDGIDVYLGDASALNDKAPFDLVIANINRNILLSDMHLYAAKMKEGANIYMSGFYTQDVEKITAEAQRCGLFHVDTKSMDNWACVKFEKKSKQGV